MAKSKREHLPTEGKYVGSIVLKILNENFSIIQIQFRSIDLTKNDKQIHETIGKICVKYL